MNNDIINRYYAQQRQKAEGIGYLIVVGGITAFSFLIWLAGTAIVALALSFTVHRFTFWQWFITCLAAFIVFRRVASWFRKGAA